MSSVATAEDVVDTEEVGHPHRWAVLAVLSAVAFMAQLDLFIVNVAIPAMGRSFAGDGLGSLSWVLNAYAIVFAALLVPAGRLADHYGRRRCLLVGVGIFTVASALCGVAPDLEALVVARALQAVGAAMIVPTSLGLLLPAFAPRQHRMVIGIWAGVAAVAASLGPPIGGLLVQVDWRWIFAVNVPIGIAVVVVGRLLLPEVRARRGARLPDPVATLSVLATVTLLTLAMVQGSSWGWTSGGEGAIVAAFVIALAVALHRTFTSSRPVIEPALFRSRPFAVASVALVLYFMGFAAWLLGNVLYFENVWHFSAMTTAVAIVPGPVLAATTALNSGRLSARFGDRTLAVVGPFLFAAGVLWWWQVGTTAHSHYLVGFLPGLIVAGAGSGLTPQAPLFASTSTLPEDRATTGSAILSMSRQVGSALGVAVVVALYASPDPHLLSAFRRGWVFMAVTATLAGLTSLVVPMTAPSRRRHDQGDELAVRGG